MIFFALTDLAVVSWLLWLRSGAIDLADAIDNADAREAEAQCGVVIPFPVRNSLHEEAA